ncbi:MAG: hypothetical protein PCFJNLEI_01604 [Verrucomicrobiae bacterium]|nr:hypothetical protein [Verrucomicrobiae bacterium]
MAICPRCRQELVDNQVDEFSVAVCQPCHGVFVRHADLVSILDRSWRAIPAATAEKAEFVAPENWQHEPLLRCPKCVAPLEKYGYMGLAAIQIDRCDRCESVWLDAAELENMVVALARSNYRSEKSLRREWDASRDIASVGMVGMAPRSLREGQRNAFRSLIRLLE